MIEFYSYLLSLQLKHTISSCILYDEVALSKVDLFLAQKGTSDLFTDLFRSIITNKRLHICKSMKNPFIRFYNAGSLSSLLSSHFNIISQSFRAISSCLSISHKIHIFKNYFYTNNRYIREHLPDYLENRLILFSCLLSPENKSFSQIDLELQNVLPETIIRNYVDYSQLESINQRCCTFMLILHQSFQQYLELINNNTLLYDYLGKYIYVYLRLFFEIHSIIPSDFTISTGLFSNTFYSKIAIVLFTASKQIIEISPTLDLQKPLCYTVSYFRSGYSIFLLLNTIIIQQNLLGETVSNCYQFSLMNHLAPFGKYFIFKPICNLSFITNLVQNGFVIGHRSLNKCLQLNYDIQVKESPDGLLFNLNI